MAVFKQSEDFLPLSGKIGGQSLANTRGPGTIRNITQTNKAGTILQRSQRFTTYYFAAKYMALHPQLKADWSAASLDYFYIATDSSLTQRTGYGTFLYINQNRFLIGLPLLLEPPIYTPVITPAIATSIDNNNKLTITTPDRKLNQTYAIFANMAIGLGATMKPGLGYFCGTISQTELDNGVNILPMISARFPGTFGKVNIGFYLSAIAEDNGNRDQFPEMNNQITLVPEKLISVDILSYYPFPDDALDYFDNNNAVYTATAFDQFGIVDWQSLQSAALSTYINLGNNSSFNFPIAGDVGPYSFCGWYFTSSATLQSIISKMPLNTTSNNLSYELLSNVTELVLGIYEGVFFKRFIIIQNFAIPLNEQIFFAVSYRDGSDVQLIVNSASSNTYQTFGTYTKQAITTGSVVLGRHPTLTARKLKGGMSELTFFNEALTPAQFEKIRQANIAGQTILDINA